MAEFFWHAPPSSTGRYEVLPDARVDLVWIRGAAGDRLEVHGPATRRRWLEVERGAAYAGVRLKPECAAAVLGREAWRANDCVLPSADLLGFAVHDFVRIHDLTTTVSAFTPVLRAVARRLHARAAWVRRARRRIEGARGQVRMEALADELGLTLRTLQRVFRSEVGVTPKQYALIQRLEDLAEQLRRGPVNWADLAADFGYADQAHLSRDLKRFTGDAPRAFATRVRAMPGGWV